MVPLVGNNSIEELHLSDFPESETERQRLSQMCIDWDSGGFNQCTLPSPSATLKICNELIYDLPEKTSLTKGKRRALKLAEDDQKPVLTVGTSGTTVCAVATMESFPGCPPDPLCRFFVAGANLTLQDENAWLKRLSDGKFTYLGIGGASAAAKAGLPDRTIRRCGIWRSDAYLTYVRTNGQISAELPTWAWEVLQPLPKQSCLIGLSDAVGDGEAMRA